MSLTRYLPITLSLFLPQLGCIDGDPEEDLGEIDQAATVTWASTVGVTAVGNDLTKTAVQQLWNAGAISTNSIVGNGYFEFTTGESTTGKMAGLSVGNTNQTYQDIDFAIHLKPNGTVSVRENGTLRGDFGTYVAGDVFRVTASGSVITYARNGTVFYTSTGTPGSPLIVDTSFLTPAGTILDAVVATGLTWQNVVGVTTTENSLTKPNTNPANAGASSTNTISNAGYVEFTTNEANTTKMAGLGNGDTNQHHADIEYAIHLKFDGNVRIYEGGTLKIGNFGTYVAGDVFRVQATGAVVTYLKNGVTIFTSTVAPTYPLRVDTSLRTAGATLINIVLQQQ